MHAGKAKPEVLQALGGKHAKLPALLSICNGDLALREAYTVGAAWWVLGWWLHLRV